MQPLPLSHPGLPGDLVLLAAERTVTVTREEHHQDVPGGRTGPTIAELRPCTITAGKHAGRDGLEVVLDGRRVGELTRLMAQRYRPMVDEVRSRGYRAGCEAVLAADVRGIQVELRLPSATERRVIEPPTAPIIVPAPTGASRWPGRPGDRRLPRRYPAAQASTGGDPRRPRPVPASARGRPGTAGQPPAAVPPPARGVGCGCRSAGARLGAGQRLAGRGARRQLVGAAVCRGGTGGARCGRAETRDDESRAGRSGGRTRSTLDGAGAATRTRDVEAHDVHACIPRSTGGAKACTEARAGRC